jgi:hypothetical protein
MLRYSMPVQFCFPIMDIGNVNVCPGSAAVPGAGAT